MGITKSDSFSGRINKMSNLFKALGHPARIAIIEHLLKVNECICGDLVDKLPLSQATISQHLKELKENGLIKGTIEGNAICYCIDSETISILKQYINKLTDKIHKNKIACC